MSSAPEIKTYTQAMRIIVDHLREIALQHGALKNWCRIHGLDYPVIIKIKNEKMPYYLPQLVERLLSIMGYQVSMSRNYLNDRTEDIYTVRKPPSPNPPPDK